MSDALRTTYIPNFDCGRFACGHGTDRGLDYPKFIHSCPKRVSLDFDTTDSGGNRCLGCTVVCEGVTGFGLRLLLERWSAEDEKKPQLGFSGSCCLCVVFQKILGNSQSAMDSAIHSRGLILEIFKVSWVHSLGSGQAPEALACTDTMTTQVEGSSHEPERC